MKIKFGKESKKESGFKATIIQTTDGKTNEDEVISFNVECDDDGRATGKVNLIDESDGSDAGYFVMDKDTVRKHETFRN